MAEYEVNDDGVRHARDLIDVHQYVLESDWGRSRPSADEENDYLERHSWS